MLNPSEFYECLLCCCFLAVAIGLVIGGTMVLCTVFGAEKKYIVKNQVIDSSVEAVVKAAQTASQIYVCKPVDVVKMIKK